MEKWQNPETLALWILIIVVFIALLAGALVALVNSSFNRIIHAKLEEARLKLEHQQELLNVSIHAGENEKQHIASELHDHFGVSLSTLKIWINRLHDSTGEQREQCFSKITTLIDRNIEDVRDLSHEIYPPMLREWGLAAALKEIAFDLREKITVSVILKEDAAAFDYQANLQLFRVCQEFVHNSLKYAEADRLEIRCRIAGNRFFLLLSDNGKGFDKEKALAAGGLGIRNMYARSQAIKASCRLRSRTGKGTVFLLIKELK